MEWPAVTARRTCARGAAQTSSFSNKCLAVEKLRKRCGPPRESRTQVRTLAQAGPCTSPQPKGPEAVPPPSAKPRRSKPRGRCGQDLPTTACAGRRSCELREKQQRAQIPLRHKALVQLNSHLHLNRRAPWSRRARFWDTTRTLQVVLILRGLFVFTQM